MEPTRVPLLCRANAAQGERERDYAEGLPDSPSGSATTCWSPFLVFSVALTGF